VRAAGVERCDGAALGARHGQRGAFLFTEKIIIDLVPFGCVELAALDSLLLREM